MTWYLTEGSFQGLHTKIVTLGLQSGMVLFIISEVFFFLSFFWAFFHASLAPNIELGSQWPPIGIIPFSPWGVPLLNTIILLSSRITVILYRRMPESSLDSLQLSILLGIYFICFKGLEYRESIYSVTPITFILVWIRLIIFVFHMLFFYLLKKEKIGF